MMRAKPDASADEARDTAAPVGNLGSTVSRDADTASAMRELASIAPVLALAACGGGDSDQGAPVVSLPVPSEPMPTAAQASRLLGQATMGATREEIARV